MHNLNCKLSIDIIISLENSEKVILHTGMGCLVYEAVLHLGEPNNPLAQIFYLFDPKMTCFINRSLDMTICTVAYLYITLLLSRNCFLPLGSFVFKMLSPCFTYSDASQLLNNNLSSTILHCSTFTLSKAVIIDAIFV